MTRNVENTEALARDAWQDALDDFTKIHQGDGATIEVVDRTFGDQVEATELLPLAYIEYDPKDDVVVVAVGGQTARFPVVLRHIIEHPEQISIYPPRPTPTETVAVTDREGTQTIVTLHARPALRGD
jgi:hypothetical protein